MKIYRQICSVIAFALCITLLLQSVPNKVTAESIEIVSYVSDIKLIYANNLNEAKSALPKGYKLYEQDINDGTDSIGVYLCYTTTTDARKAITDVRAMNEEAGFDRGTFNEKMDQAIKSLDSQADQQPLSIHQLQEFMLRLRNLVLIKFMVWFMVLKE